MSAVHELTGTQVVVDGAGVVRTRSLKAPIAFAIVAAIGLLLAFPGSRAGESTFRLSDRTQSLQLPDVALPTAGTVIACALILTVMAALTFVFSAQYKRIRCGSPWSSRSSASSCSSPGPPPVASSP